MRPATFIVLAVALLVLLSACTTMPPAPSVPSRLDSSGVTVVALSEAIVLAKPLRALAAGARDYAYVGPVEINRMGERSYYFWIGLASTVDREFIGQPPVHADSLLLIVNGEPMLLPLTEWNTELDMPPYTSTAPIYVALAAHTSLDQIHRIAEAEQVELHIISSAYLNSRYTPWLGDWMSWLEFPHGN